MSKNKRQMSFHPQQQCRKDVANKQKFYHLESLSIMLCIIDIYCRRFRHRSKITIGHVVL